MPDEDKKPKSFLQITWQQVVSAVIGALFLGILGWVGGTLRGALEDVGELKEWKTETQTGLTHTLERLDDAIKNNSSKMGTMSGEVRRLEILVNRLDAIIDKMGK